MPAPPAAAEAAILATDTDVVRYIEIYEGDGSTPFTVGGEAVSPGLVEGSVSVSYGRDERRTCDLTLDNRDGELAHYPGGFWYDKVVKVFRGVDYDGLRWAAQIGEFTIDSIESQHFPHTVHVTGRDYTAWCLTSKFTAATSFSSGQYLVDVIKAIALNAGITKFILPSSTTEPSQLGRTFFFERGTERWKAMKDMATAYGFELFFDAQGYLVLRRFVDPALAPESYTFETGAYGNLVSYRKRTSGSRIYNSIVVTGEATDQIPVSAVARNTNPSSPTHIRQPGEATGLAERVYQYSSPFITTTDQAQAVADNFLKVHSLEEFDLDLESIVLPWLEVGEVVEFLDPDPNPGDPTKFFLTDFSIPMALGPMSLVAKRVVIVG